MSSDAIVDGGRGCRVIVLDDAERNLMMEMRLQAFCATQAWDVGRMMTSLMP